MKVFEYQDKALTIWNSACCDLDNIYGAIGCRSKSYNTLNFRFGHIVWEDFNYESWHIQWCLDQQNNTDYNDMEPFEKEILVKSLQMLLEDLPKYEECEDYEQV